MSDIRAGDLVVCVDASRPIDACSALGMELAAKVCRIGAVYRVREVVAAWSGPRAGMPCLRLVGINSDPYAGFAAERFRKLNDDPEDAALIARIKRCRPAKQPACLKGKSAVVVGGRG